LESQLSSGVPTVGLGFDQAKSAWFKARESRQASHDATGRPVEFVWASLDDTTKASLPFQDKANCELAVSQARSLGQFSRHLHGKIATIESDMRFRSSPPASSSSFSRSASFSETMSELAGRNAELVNALGQEGDYQKPEAVSALVQILEAEPSEVRQKLVELLAQQPTPEATRALTRRAVFDTSQSVRQYAIHALSRRPQGEYRPQLLEALRYPWSPAAWHAAETLAAVNDGEAVPDLIALLDAPDPRDPFRDASGKMMVRELVRLNHFQNCLLCHAPSQGEPGLATGSVPTPGIPLRPVYYGSHRSAGDVFVRADVTYLRQDFSVMHDTMDARPWPERQRFDYLVRAREATTAEIAAHEAAPADKRLHYPQRKAVLFALKRLTGQNLGPRSEDWQQLLDEPR
jgi:hypothetical protein